MAASDHLNEVQFHGTPFPSGFPHDEWMHVGTRQAAEERLRSIHPRDYGLPDDSPATIHTVRLQGRVYPHTLSDDEANEITSMHPSQMSRLAPEDIPDAPNYGGYKVFPYTNDGEHKGSVSYIAHRSAIQRVSTVHLTGYRWRDPSQPQ